MGRRVDRFTLIFRSLAIQAAVIASVSAASAQAQSSCGAAWRTVSDTVAGATYEMAADPRRDYFMTYGDNLPASSNEQGFLDEGTGCATFTATVWDLGTQHVADVDGFLNAYQANATRNEKVIWSRSRRVNGYPAREFLTSRVVDIINRLVYYRTLAVVRGNQVLLFSSHWEGGENSPIADRVYRSVALQAGGATSNLRSFALLSHAITKYWMFDYKGPFTNVFAQDLLATLEARKAQDAATIKAFGYPRTFTAMGAGASAKIVRVKHDNATVDWTVPDNGTVLTAISWRKVNPGTAGSASVAAKTPAAAGARFDLEAIKAARARFVTSLITTPAYNTRFHVFGGSDWCEISYAILPAGKTPEQLTEILKIDWRRAKSIAFLPGRPEATPWFKNYVEVENFNGGTWPLHPGTDQVGPMLAAGNEMMRLCKAAPK